jgi:uncharacterized protein GlcG (DUF336 family)
MNPTPGRNLPSPAAIPTVLGSLLFALACGSGAADAVTAAAENAPAEAAAPVAAARGPELAVAVEAAQAALDNCRSRGFSVSASVVDSAGILKVLLASDGAAPRGVQSSQNKAITALAFKAPTSLLGERAKTDKSFADTVAANSNYNVRAGGVLLTVKGEIIGALGVGGAHPSEVDEACANAGVAQVKPLLENPQH